MNRAPRAKRIDVLLVTCEEFPYLTSDDRILQRALESRGLRAGAAIWNDPPQAAARFADAIVRALPTDGDASNAVSAPTD